MTNQEAIETIKANYPDERYTMLREALDMAMELLKAQEPVKPIERNGFYYCESCRYAFTVNRQKYCTDCGKAVKWE